MFPCVYVSVWRARVCVCVCVCMSVGVFLCMCLAMFVCRSMCACGCMSVGVSYHVTGEVAIYHKHSSVNYKDGFIYGDVVTGWHNITM